MDSYQDYLNYENKMQREGLFEVLSQNYNIESAIYPGSYIHISPSFYFKEVVYIDSDKKAKKFFADLSFEKIINTKKAYPGDSIYHFYPTNYLSKIPEKLNHFDLLISQYAGFVSQACKKYLKLDGILVANNSHGDAGVANADPDYKFIGLIQFRQKKFTFSTKNLNEYFIPKKEGRNLTLEYLLTLNRGIGFKKVANHYIFKRVR